MSNSSQKKYFNVSNIDTVDYFKNLSPTQYMQNHIQFKEGPGSNIMLWLSEIALFSVFPNPVAYEQN